MLSGKNENGINYYTARKLKDMAQSLEPVSYTHLDVYKRQVKRFLNDFYQTTSGTDYCSIRLFCFKKNRYGSLVPDHDLENVTLATYVAACLELNPSMNVRDGRGLKSNSVVHFHTA